MCSFTSYRPEAVTLTSREHKLHLAYCLPALLGTVILPNFSNHSFWNFPVHFRLFAGGAILGSLDRCTFFGQSVDFRSSTPSIVHYNELKHRLTINGYFIESNVIVFFV